VSQEQGGIVAWVGFPEWVRGPARIADGEVVLDEARAERYTPHDIDQAIFELATARDYQDLRAFVRRYGLLWHGPDSLGTEECRESLSDWQIAAHEAATVILLYMRLRETARTGSADPVRSLNMTWEDVRKTPNDEDYLKQVSMRLSGLVNNHVARYPTVLIPAYCFEDEADVGQFVFGHQPPSLHAALYTTFATLIA
jgi:hypothetical protein